MTQQVSTVSFHGYPLTVVHQGNQLWVAMKPICENIGLQWEAQHKRIQRDEVLSEGMSIMDMPSAGGMQSTACLPLEMLNGWLFGVDANRVDESIRAKLIQYKKECYQVLSDYWHGGVAVNPRQVVKVEHLSSEQCVMLKGLVQDRVAALPYPHQAKGAAKCWSALKSKFGCSYKEIPPSEYPEAVSLVARLTLEGECLPNALALDNETSLYAQTAIAFDASEHRKMQAAEGCQVLNELRSYLPDCEYHLADQIEGILAALSTGR